MAKAKRKMSLRAISSPTTPVSLLMPFALKLKRFLWPAQDFTVIRGIRHRRGTDRTRTMALGHSVKLRSREQHDMPVACDVPIGQERKHCSEMTRLYVFKEQSRASPLAAALGQRLKERVALVDGNVVHHVGDHH